MSIVRKYFQETSVSDPYHLAGSGSGSASGNVDLDPGKKPYTEKIKKKNQNDTDPKHCFH